MKTWTSTPEEFAKGAAGSRVKELLRARPKQPKRAARVGIDRQIGTITPEQFGRGEAYWTGLRRQGHRTKPSSVIKPMEAVLHALPDTGIEDLPKLKQPAKPAKPGDDIEPPDSSLDEARLPDLLLDLADIYGNAFPRPKGNVLQFTLVDDNTTYETALEKITGILNNNGLTPLGLTVTPGPEQKKPFNRSIIILMAKGDLM